MVKKTVFIILIFYSAFLFLSGVLPPILAHFKFYQLSGNLTYLMSAACHQQPDRSFWLLGYPMALCSRCLGVYLGFFVYLSKRLSNLDEDKIKISIIIFLLIISSLDIFLNFLLNINTGIIIRFIIGNCIGICIAYTLEILLQQIERGIKLCLQKK